MKDILETKSRFLYLSACRIFTEQICMHKCVIEKDLFTIFSLSHNQLFIQSAHIFETTDQRSIKISLLKEICQPKPKSPRVVLLSVRKPPPHHTGDDYICSTFRQPRKLSLGMQPYFNPTWRYMESHLICFVNGRWPRLFFKSKTTSIFLENGRRDQFFSNGRQSECYFDLKIT